MLGSILGIKDGMAMTIQQDCKDKRRRRVVVGFGCVFCVFALRCVLRRYAIIYVVSFLTLTALTHPGNPESHVLIF